MTAQLSAEELATGLGLAADDLLKPCDSNIIPSLADCFSQWRVIFASLLSEIDFHDVEEDTPTQPEKRIAALRKWQARNGDKATYKILVDTLLMKGEKSQAENLCKIVADLSSDENGKHYHTKVLKDWHMIY